MTVPRRALTFNFEKSVQSTGLPSVLEVVVRPLSVSAAPSLDESLVGPPQTQSVRLDDNVSVTFYLVPTDYPELTQRVPYRAAWREKYMGRQFTYDFVMPDADVDFDDLQNLGNIIGGESYLQWADRSRPNGVAGLNELGQVVDALDKPVTGAEEAAIVQGNLNAETVARQQGDQFLRDYFLQFAHDQITQVYASTAANLASEVNQLENADLIEKTARQNAVMQLNARLVALQHQTNTDIGEINESVSDLEGQLDLKADLINGKVPTSQIPSVSIGHAVSVTDEQEMLALTSAQVQEGDFAVRPDGVWFLNALPPSVLSNWVEFTAAGTVASVNGHTGVVVLNAADVGARPAGVAIPQIEVTGLNATLAGKTNTSTTTTLSNRVTAIETDPTIVKTVAGEIAKAQSGSYLVYLDSSDRLVKKTGELLDVGAVEGGTFDIDDVTGLQAALDGKKNTIDTAVPTAHATSHQSGGTDALTLAQSQVAGLAPIISNNGLTVSSAHENRIAALEVGGGGGGGGDIAKANWFNGSAIHSGVTDPGSFQITHGVQLRGPFSRDGSGNYAYNPSGVAPVGDTYVYAYITPNGHLEFRQWDESAPEDDPIVLQPALDATNSAVALKASQASLDALSTRVDTKADTVALNSVATAVSTKAEQSALDATNSVVGTKADQSALTLLQGTVTGLASSKANQSDLNNLTTTVSNKADLSAGKVPLTQIPNLPTSRVTNLDSTLVAKADLSGGTVPQAQLPALPFSKVVNLQPTLDGKADLVGGKVPTSQIPAIALNAVVPVSSKPAMLALTTAQVQPGDIAVITDTVDAGSYILSGTDPSVESNWVKLSTPSTGAVASVNGQTGTVVLSAADVGARSSSTTIPQTDVAGLTTALAAKADTSAVNTALATKPSTTDVQTLLTASQQNKLGADLVATAAILTLSGQQSIDGVLAPLNSRVLLTGQPSSPANGLYVVSSGVWSRVADMAAGNYFVKGSVVTVTGGNNHANTFWQQVSDSGVVGTNSNNWVKIMTAGAPPVYTATLGVQRVGNDFRAQVVSGGGISATASGLQLDPNVAARKFAGDVPATGSKIVTVTHNLNTLDVQATFREKSPGDVVLVGWKPTGLNTLSAEFDAVPSSGQWRVVVHG